MIKTSFFILLVALLFLGCSTKEYYDPADVKDSIELTDRLDSEIIELNAQSATLEDGTIITKNGLENIQFPLGYRFVFKNEQWALALKTGGEIFAVKNKNESKSLKLSKTVATLALRGDILAVIFADNELALYQFSSGKLLFKQPASESTAVDMRIATPRFLNDLVLFPTLDGKIVIVNVEQKELVRTIIVSSEQYFNNIIYFNVVNDILYAATPSKVYSLGEKELRLTLEARNMLVNEKGVWVATKQGEIIALNHKLNILAKKKYPFAHFLGMLMVGESLYVAEKQGYIIILDKNLDNDLVYDFDLEEGLFFSGENGFYFDNVYIRFQ